MRSVYTDHEQVHFITAEGLETFVDEGVFEVMMLLKHFGVRTQYSCQGHDGIPAYVCTDRKSLAPLLRAIRRNYRRGTYSPAAATFVERLFAGTPEFWLYWELDGLTHSRHYQRGVNPNEGFEIEYSYNRPFGLRTVLRWPETAMDDFKILLEQTYI